MTPRKPSKLSEYIMSEQFQENARRGVAKAVAEARAAGLIPAGDSRIKPSTCPATVVIIEAPKPLNPAKRVPK